MVLSCAVMAPVPPHLSFPSLWTVAGCFSWLGEFYMGYGSMICGPSKTMCENSRSVNQYICSGKLGQFTVLIWSCLKLGCLTSMSQLCPLMLLLTTIGIWRRGLRHAQVIPNRCLRSGPAFLQNKELQMLLHLWIQQKPTSKRGLCASIAWTNYYVLQQLACK